MAKMTFSETDNQKEVYNIAKLLMDAVPITLNERIPVFCSHPFTDFIYTPQINNNKIDKTWNLTNPKDFEEWRTAILQRLEQSEIRNMFYITSKAYRLTFLKYAQPYLTKQTFSELFGDIWVTSENPNDDVNVSLRELVNWFRNANKKFLMDEKDYAAWETLPETMELYRGVGISRKQYGLSWTTNLEKAAWFAHRFDKGSEMGYIQKAIVSKKDMLAYFQSREEEEVVVDTFKIKKMIEKVNN